MNECLGLLIVSAIVSFALGGWWLFFFIRFRFKKLHTPWKAALNALGAAVLSFMYFFLAGEPMHVMPDPYRKVFEFVYPVIGIGWLLFPYVYAAIFFYRRKNSRLNL